MLVANPGEKVQIFTSNRNPDDLVYEVEDVKRGVYHLRCLKTNRMIKAHRSRIRTILHMENNMNATDTVVNDVAVDEAETGEMTGIIESDIILNTKDKPIKVKTNEAPPQFDFQEFTNQGNEIWVKENLNFDIEGVDVKAICMISEDNASYRTFNIYNGSLGKKGTFGQEYNFTDKMTIDKKRKQLQKKGYSQFIGE